jgi:hypothetical protein
MLCISARPYRLRKTHALYQGTTLVGQDDGADRASYDADVSIIPPKIPYGGFSPVRLQGWLSAGAFPRRRPRVAPSRFASRLRARRCNVTFSAQCRSTLCAQAPPFKRLRRSTPGALAPVRVILSRSIITYPAPSDPLAGTARFHCSAAYTPCLRCAFPPKRPATGSVLSPLILSQHVVLCDSGESGGCIHPVPSPPTLAFVPLVQTRHSHTSR